MTRLVCQNADAAPLAATARRALATVLAPSLVIALAVDSCAGPAGPLHEPAGGSGGWAVLGLVAVATVVSGIILRWLLSRRGPAPETASPPGALGSPAAAPPPPESTNERVWPEAEALMGAFSKMLALIEQQAGEISQYAARLDSAYTEIETSNARLKEFSFKDEVTGLYNRRFFSIRLEEEVSRYRRFDHPVSVVLLDLDGFKAVNDELGHAAGDETLRGMAEILLKHSRGINVICRYGGDEFAILLVETSKAGARLYADRIRVACCRPSVVPPWAARHRELRNRLAARGRGAVAGRADPRRRRGALRRQACREESGVRPRGHRGGPDRARAAPRGI